jgi:biofilm PGA synthesis protein PgaA
MILEMVLSNLKHDNLCAGYLNISLLCLRRQSQQVLRAGLVIIAFSAGTAYAADSTGVATPDTISAETADTLYRNAVADARAGRTEQALSVLQSLVERFPQRQDILGDYAVVQGWSGDHAAALGLIDKITLNSAPSYVIEGLANSARQLKRYDLAESLYREAMARFPERLEAQIGLALTLTDAGKLDDATAVIEPLYAKYPRRIDVLEAVAYIATAKQDYFGALAAYQAILALEPDNRDALRGKIQTLGHLGTPQLAIELADANPGVLTPAEREAFAADRTAHKIRWGAITANAGRGPTRFADIDHALADSEVAAARALDATVELNATERQLVLDRISALSVRYRMRDAVVLYEAMAARPVAIPAYAKSAAASAYLYLEQPQKARDLYREALVTDPDNLESRIGLFYALAENEEHEAALKEIEGAVAITPQWIDAWSQATIRENPNYAGALSARATAPLLANRPGEAEQRLHELSDRAPYNMDVRTDYASSMRARGWPRTAEQELRWILEIDPDNSGALGEHAGALLEMRDYRNAESALALGQEVAAEDGRVVRAGRLWQVHNMNELIVDGTYGQSGGGPNGTEDFALESWLYSKPIAYNYRVFGHIYDAQAKFLDGIGRIERAGVGLEYRSPLVTVSGELIQGNHDKTAAAVSLAITPDDYWTLRTEYETSSNQTPLQASLAGIDAHRVSGEIDWQANESRSAALSYDRMNFTDGNHRDTVQTHWTERVIAGPVYKLEVTGALYTSRNSLAGTPYFNPSRDFSPTLELTNEWLQWRHYTRDFRHRIIFSVGNYWQQSFSTGQVYDVHYEQEWNADDRLTLRYGIGRNDHPYDGVQTTSNYGYFYLNWKF